MPVKAFCRGKLIDEWSQGKTKIKVFDGALVAQIKNDPKVIKILDRIAEIAIFAPESESSYMNDSNNEKTD